METEMVEKYIIDKGIFIAQILSKTYSEADFDIDSVAIEREIYGTALAYAKVFIFENGKYLNELSRADLRSQISSRFAISSNKLKNLNDTDIIAHLIKSEAIKQLGKSGRTII